MMLAMGIDSETRELMRFSGQKWLETCANWRSATAEQAGNANYNPAVPATANIVINKANQIIIGFTPVTSITYSNGGSFSLTASGGASGNAVTFASTTPTVCEVNGNAASILAVGICSLTADQSGNNNYNPAPQVTATVTINKANQTITGFTPASPVTYSTGGSITLAATGGASGNPVIFASTTPTVCAVTGNVALILSVGTCTLTADQAGNLNYNPAIQITATIIINKADQIISGFTPATPIAYAIGGTFILSATGGTSGNAVTFASTTPAVCSVSGNVATIQTAGACVLTADQTGNSNYNTAPQATASVTINKASQSITGFNPATPIAYTSGGTFALTATGGASGNAVVYATTTSTVCSVTGNVATILAVGTCTLTADQAGTANYNAATPVTVSVVINKTAQTITGFSPAGHVSLAAGGTFTLAATGGASGNPVTFTSSTAVVCTTGGVNGATVTVVAAGTCALTANQAGNATFNAASPVSAPVLITILAPEGQVYYIHPDHLGTPRAITKATDNAVVWKWENSDPFGANAPNEDPTNTGGAFKYNLRFPGQYYDQETGTHYNYFRDYDPTTGRYVQSDPIGLRGGISTYGYTFGNPASLSDPFGLLVMRINSTRESLHYQPNRAYQNRPGLPATSAPGSGGRTLIEYSVGSKCSCTNGGGYKFDEFILDITPIVRIKSGNGAEFLAWARRAEADHVGDLLGWANGSAKQIAQERESRYKLSTFASIQACEEATTSSLEQALDASVDAVLRASSAKWDKSGLHDYNNPNRRR